MLDEVQIWSRALSATEIQADYYSLSGSEFGLYAYYRFDEGSGGTTTNRERAYRSRSSVADLRPTVTLAPALRENSSALIRRPNPSLSTRT